MRNSIVTKLFVLCLALIFASVVCIGSVLLLVSVQYFKTEKREALLAVNAKVIDATKLCSLDNQTPGTEDIHNILSEYAASSGAVITVVGETGVLVSCSEDNCAHTTKEISAAFLDEVKEDGLFACNTMDGFYSENRFIYAYPFTENDVKYYVVSTMSARSIDEFTVSMFKVFFAVMMVVLAVVFIIIRVVLTKQFEPVHRMTEAAYRYGKGDFSETIDITTEDELGVLAKSMNDMAYSLSVLDNTRKSFIANVSHELKTPMTTIGGFVDGILDGTIPKEQHRHYLKIVSDEVSRLARLVKSMLNIAKYETGEIEMKTKEFDLRELTIKTVLNFEDRIENKEIDIQGLDGDSCKAVADPDLVAQIIYNLVENAVKFVNKGGYIRFDLSDSDGKTTFSVRNSGEGLTEEELPKVFERFYKTDESHGKDKTGVGLGLAIVRSIVNLHNGKIMVKSTKGEYTEFTITFPLESAKS